MNEILTFENLSQVYAAAAKIRANNLVAGLRPQPPGVESRCGLCLQIQAEQRDACIVAVEPIVIVNRYMNIDGVWTSA